MNRVVGAAAVAWLAAIGVAIGQSRYAGALDQHPAIDYRGGALNDAATVLARDIKGGKTSLAFDGQQRFLRSLLERLNVPVESQLLCSRRPVCRRRTPVRRLPGRFTQRPRDRRLHPALRCSRLHRTIPVRA